MVHLILDMRGIKIPLNDFALKMQGRGGLMREGGGVFAGHYGSYCTTSNADAKLNDFEEF